MQCVQRRKYDLGDPAEYAAEEKIIREISFFIRCDRNVFCFHGISVRKDRGNYAYNDVWSRIMEPEKQGAPCLRGIRMI